MNSQQIETFLTIVETNSIVRASELLFLSQPTVSYRLKSLENELGFPLLERSKGLRNVELTQKGKAFVPIALSWMQLWQDIQRLTAAETKIPLTLSCSSAISMHLLTPLCKTLTGSHDMFDLTIQTTTVEETYRSIANGDADIGLSFEVLSNDAVMVEPVFRERMVLAKVCDNRNEIRTAYHPGELKIEDELFLNSCDSYKIWHDEWFGTSAHPYVNVNNESLLPNLLDSSRFWTIIPASVFGVFNNRPDVKIYELLYPPEARTCYRITSRTPAADKRRGIQIFNDTLKTYLHNRGLDSLV